MDYIAMVFTALGMVTTGKKWAWGWIINGVGSLLWLTVAVDEKIWGLMVLNVFLVTMAGYNYYKWIKHEKN